MGMSFLLAAKEAGYETASRGGTKEAKLQALAAMPAPSNNFCHILLMGYKVHNRSKVAVECAPDI